MLYCLLTGQPPFTGKTLVDVIQAKEAGTFAPARQSNPEVPEKLDLVILKMTAKQVKYRYASCAEVIRDLESLGLASARLEFLDQPDAGPKSVPLKAAKTTVPQAQSTMTPAPPTKPPPDVWYLRQRTGDGVGVVRKMTTAQLLEWIGGEQFDPATKVSRSSREGFRTLATYKEFQSAVLGRTARSGVDKQTSRFRKEFKKIEDAEQKRAQATKEEESVDATGYWLGICWRVAAVVGVLVGLVLLVQLAIDGLKSVFQ